jgi:hypothetical protein
VNGLASSVKKLALKEVHREGELEKVTINKNIS